ncbi:hypothetical protein ACLOJK_012827 [Asimina triloba]
MGCKPLYPWPKNPSFNDNDGDTIEGNDGDLTLCPKNSSINDIDRELTRLIATTTTTMRSRAEGLPPSADDSDRNRENMGRSGEDPGDEGDEKVLRHADET